MKTGQMRTPQGRELSKQVSPEEGTRWELPKSSLSLAHPGLASTQLDAQANILNVRLFGAGVRGMPADRTHGPEELRSGLHSKQTNKKKHFLENLAWKMGRSSHAYLSSSSDSQPITRVPSSKKLQFNPAIQEYT